MKTLYSTKMTNNGGRDGKASSPDGSLSFMMSAPGSEKPNTTNPEQLFAAGYSSCFNGALAAVLEQEKIEAQSTISATVSLCSGGVLDYFLAVEIEGHIEGVSMEDAEILMQKAHKVCPYSKATAGNIEVTLKVV